MKNTVSSKQKAVSRENTEVFTAYCLLPTARCSGFTLVETMVAISILTLSVAGPLYTAGRAIAAAVTARDRLTASYLAQEGIEFMRAMRDNEFLVAYQAGGGSVSSTAWNGFIAGPVPADPYTISGCIATTCTLDTYPGVPMGTGSGSALLPCSGGACTPLYLANGVYTQKSNIGGTVTAFTRTVQAITVSATDERIVSTVSWNYHGTPYSVSSIGHVTPWQ